MTTVGKPVVSVIVTTRNSARTLAVCLKSIRGQTYSAIELIVIDNQSHDGSAQIAKELAEVVEDWGPERSAQRNRGAKLSQGDYLLFVDSDMVLAPSIVEECVEVAQKTGYGAVVVPEISTGQGFLAACRALERSCYEGDDTIESARFFSRAAYEDSGGFDESLTGPEDRDLTVRMAKVGVARTA